MAWSLFDAQLQLLCTALCFPTTSLTQSLRGQEVEQHTQHTKETSVQSAGIRDEHKMAAAT